MSIGITINSKSYTPEAYAYENFLKNKGHTVELGLNNCFKETHDLYILFMGIDSVFHKNPFKGAKIIHEYHSLSTGKFPRLKNKVKQIVNRKPNGRIFLNKQVQKEIIFNDDTPFILRDMGVDEAFFSNDTNTPKEYDILYSGSIIGRVGLIETIIKLAKKGFSFLIIGHYTDDVKQAFEKYPKITLLGRVSREQLPHLYQKCEFALNYTPDIYPFNIQTSTKILEYCACNLKIISNKYQWISSFSDNRNANFYWLTPDSTYTDICNFNYLTPKVNELEWNSLLENIHFDQFIQDICKK